MSLTISTTNTRVRRPKQFMRAAPARVALAQVPLPPSSFVPIAFRGVDGQAGGGGSSPTESIPSLIIPVVGDVLLFAVTMTQEVTFRDHGVGELASWPPSFHLLGNDTVVKNGLVVLRHVVFYKVMQQVDVDAWAAWIAAGGGEFNLGLQPNYVFTITGGDFPATQFMGGLYSGVDPVNPINANAVVTGSVDPSAAVFPTPRVTTTAEHCRTVEIIGSDITLYPNGPKVTGPPTIRSYRTLFGGMNVIFWWADQDQVTAGLSDPLPDATVEYTI